MLEAFPAVTVPVLPKAGCRLRSFSSLKRLGPFIPIDGDRGAAAGNFDGRDFLGEQALLLGLDRPLKTGHREIVLLLAGEVDTSPRSGRRSVPMCTLLYTSHRPSRIIESTSSPLPMR